MSASLARYLKDFSVPEPVISAAASHFDSDFGDSLSSLDFPDIAEMPSPDHEAELKSAFDEGHAAATQELQALHEANLAEREAQHAQELEDLKSRLLTEMSATLDARLIAISESITSKLTDQVTDVLIPVLGSMLAAKAAADLGEKVIALFEEPDGVALTVRGPSELFSVFAEKLGQGGFSIRHIETNDIDLSVEFEDTVMVTRMSAWAEATRSLGS